PYQRANYQFYNVAYAENMRYVDPFRPELGLASTVDLAKRALSNTRSLPKSIGEAVSIHHGWWIAEVHKANDFLPWLDAPIWLAEAALLVLSLPVLAGLVLLARRGYTLLVLYVAGSLALICVTPWPGQFGRYLVPLTPFLILALLFSLRSLVEHTARSSTPWRRGTRSIMAGVIGLILVQQTYTIYKLFTKHHQPATYRDAEGRRHEQRLFFYLHSWQRHEGGVDWLTRHARPGEVVGTSTPHWVYLKTGLPSVMPPYEADPREAQRLMESVPLTYLIVDSLEFIDVGRRYTIPAVEAAPDRWELVYHDPDGAPSIYRRRLRAGPAPGTNPSASLGSK
nr:hypothetical protein [Gemmatimonadales bacterium]